MSRLFNFILGESKKNPCLKDHTSLDVVVVVVVSLFYID